MTNKFRIASNNKFRVASAPLLILIATMLVSSSSVEASGIGQQLRQADEVHDTFDELLARYVRSGGVDYATWSASEENHKKLDEYVAALQEMDPADWPTGDALAYWLNLYNAITLKLILDNYPLGSIKDVHSPWGEKRAVVAGESLSLNDIENDIIRPRFGDARIHFALNCAAVSCPPLQNEAFRGRRLDAQLTTACRNALDQPGWLWIEGEIVHVTKIFDWYGGDFDAYPGGIAAFLDTYYSGPTPLPEGEYRIEYMGYDWALNRIL